MPAAPYASLALPPVEYVEAFTEKLGTFRFRTWTGLGELDLLDKRDELIREWMRPGNPAGPLMIPIPTAEGPVLTKPTYTKLQQVAVCMTRDASELKEGEVLYGLPEWLMLIAADGPEWEAVGNALAQCVVLEAARKDPKPPGLSSSAPSSPPPGAETSTTSTPSAPIG